MWEKTKKTHKIKPTGIGHAAATPRERWNEDSHTSDFQLILGYKEQYSFQSQAAGMPK